MSGNERTVASNEVYKKIQAQILHIELPPGTQLSETETANQYKLSRIPIREAFKKLESEGLLEIRPHVGTFVTRINLTLIPDVLFVRHLVECAIVRDVARIYDSSLDLRLLLPLTKQRELLESGLPHTEMNSRFLEYDNRFHDVLYEIVGRGGLSLTAHTLGMHYERFRAMINLHGSEYLTKSYKEHLQIVELIRQKDNDALTELLRHHFYDGFQCSTEIIAQYPDYFTDTQLNL